MSSKFLPYSLAENQVMPRGRVVFAVVCLLLTAAAPAFAQKQPWSPPNGRVESVVNNCVEHLPYPKIAADDFQYTANTYINLIQWWGVVSNVAQLNKRYYIAIWNNTQGVCPAACNPNAVLASWCLTPSHRTAGTDCQNRTVYRFQVSLPAPGFTATANTKYWLQISEIDQPAGESFIVGATDFWWSGYRPSRLCPAQQSPPIACNIVDDCPVPVATDLAYTLGMTALGGVIALPAAVLSSPRVFMAEIWPLGLDLGASSPMLVACIEPDDNGQYFLEHSLPDGNYNVTLIGMGVARPTRSVTIQGGVGTCDFFDVFLGDLNNDGQADGMDIQLLVDGLLHL